jgi:hypothetical protein
MKKSLATLLLFFAAVSAFGQKIRFTDSTNRWHGYYIDMWPAYSHSYTYYFTSGWVPIHGTLYKKLYGDAVAYIREDTVAKKIFATSGSPTDSSEYVFYDFSLQVGDTFKSKHAVHVVAAIDSVIINGLYHKVWYLGNINSDPGWGSLDAILIEGIGNIEDPAQPIRSSRMFEADYWLTCFTNNGTQPVLSHKIGTYFDNDTSCGMTFGLGVKQLQNGNSLVKVIPNPINEYSKITFPHSIQSGSLTILNSIGQVIFSLSFENKEELMIGDKISVPGIYCYTVTDEYSGEVLSGRFVY